MELRWNTNAGRNVGPVRYRNDPPALSASDHTTVRPSIATRRTVRTSRAGIVTRINI